MSAQPAHVERVEVLVVGADAAVPRRLSQEGLRTALAEDVNAALDAARRSPPGLVLVDHALDDGEGEALCRALKADPALADMLVLLAVPHADPERMLRGLDAGADSFIHRPCDENWLVERIRLLLLQRRHAGSAATTAVEFTLGGTRRVVGADRLKALDQLLPAYEAARPHADAQPRRAASAGGNPPRVPDSDERYRQLLNVVPVGIYATDAAGRIVEYNSAAAALWNQHPPPGEPARAVYAGLDPQASDAPPDASPDLAVLALDQAVEVRNAGLILHRGNGERVEALVNTAPIHDRDGRLAGAIHCLLDVTDRTEARRELAMSRGLAQATLDALWPRIAVLDEAGGVVAVNAAWRDFWGTRGAPPGVPPVTAEGLADDLQAIGCTPGDALAFREALAEVTGGAREQASLECHGLSPPCALLVHLRRFTFCDRTRIVVVHEDISERERQAAQLASAAERLATTLESITDGFYTVDAAWRLTYVNREAERILRRPRSEMLGQDLWSLYPDALGTDFDEHLHGAALEQRARHFEAYYPALDMWVDAHVYPSDGGLAVYFRDVSERKHSELALRQSEKNLRLAVAAAGLGTWRWNPSTGELHVSHEMKALLGLARHAPVDERRMLATVHRSERKAMLLRIAEALESGEEFRADFRVVLGDGSIRWLASVGRAYRDEERGGMRLEGVSLDISKRKQGEEELLELNERLEQRVAQRTRELVEATRHAEAANAAKSAFLAAMSHEIRTPMNGIIGMVDVLAHDRLSEHQGEAVRTIRDSAFTLLELIDDVLDFSKIEAGKLELEHTPVTLSEIAENVCDTLAALAERKGVDVFLFVTPHGPSRVWSDPVRLRQVLYNLVGNAIKFSGGRPARRGRVDLRIDIASEYPFRVRITVADNGIGMSADVQRQLFQTFRQAEVSTTRRFGGTGLGLAICKRLVELAGGSIEVESMPSRGATFTVELPLEPIPEPPTRLPTALLDTDFVVVNRSYVNAADLRVYLEWGGARIHMVEDASEAIEACRRLANPVVVHSLPDDSMRPRWLSLFAELPHVRHLVVSRGRRRVARQPAPNVVVIDGNAMRRRAFLHAAEVAIGRAAPAGLPLPVGAAEDAAPLPAAPTVAEARARGQLILVAEDDITNQRVLLRQLELLGYAAEMARDGVEALNLWRKGGYALLVTDLHMPNLDGYGLAAAIRREEDPHARLPIVALTANALRGEAERARAAGLDGYLTKPVQLTVLGEILARWLSVANEAVSARGGIQGPVETAHAVLDLDVLRRLVGDEADTAILMLADYGQSLQSSLQSLRQAEANGELAEVGRIAHRLKSSSRAVGALPFGDLCAELENASRKASQIMVTRAMARFETATAELLSEIDRHIGEN